MRNKRNNIDGLNRIFDFLGIHGGSIAIESDWTFKCRVRDLGDGDYEAELFSVNDDGDGALMDPFFRISLKYDEGRTKVVDYTPLEYLSMWWGGELRIDCIDNSCDTAGNTDREEGELNDRFTSYIGTITGIRPYLTNPKTVERYEGDVDCTYLSGDREKKRLLMEAMARMRILGVDREDIEKFGKGEFTKIYVDHEKRRVRKMEVSPEEAEIVKRAEKEAGIPFLAYYLITDSINWPDGETCTRCIIPYVRDERWDSDTDEVYKEGEPWGKIRRDILKHRTIPCYVVNAENPEYSEFGEMPYRLLDGMLFTAG